MSTNHTTTGSGFADWGYSTFAPVWDYRTGAIMAGAVRLEALSAADRTRSLTALSERVRALTRGLDEGWLTATAFFMIDDLYKSFFHQFRWSPGTEDYVAATAGVFMQELERHGFVLHYVVDNTEREANLDAMLTYLPAVFQAAGLLVTGPQLMALKLMQQIDNRPRDVRAIQLYRNEGHDVADRLIARCHQERRSSVYLNLDLDDDAPGLSVDVALSHANTPGTIVVFRRHAPTPGSVAELASPPGVTLPNS